MPVAAAHPTATRAVRIALDGTVTAADAALLVHGDERPFALTGRWAGAAALVGSEPVRLARDDEDPFALLDAQPAVDGAPAGFVGGGWFGMLGYGLGRRTETLSPPPPAPERLPDAVLAFHDHLLLLDDDGRWWFEALWSGERAAALEARLAVLRARVAAGVRERSPAVAVAPGPWWATPSPTGHARAVAACRERIAAGDLFQANLSLRLRAGLEGDPVDLFTRGVAALSPDRAAWLSGPWGAVASLSPELLVERRGDEVRSAPIKGTRPRPADPAAAEAQRAELAAAPKDRAENVMIVDLMRNDLGRVCEPGSVRVTALAEVRAHAGVWHLVSEVAGRRRAGIGDAALVSALFPPGSVTGAPKLAAMDVISELESAARQGFCGAFGFASPAAGLELSVAIRTFECRDGVVWLDVGGGVVADSDPDGEAAECLAKARPLLAAIGATLEVDGAGGAAGGASAEAPVPRRLGVHPAPRPDPAAGIFETLLVRDGVAVAAEEHLVRLGRSAQELYAVTLPAALPALLRHTALEQGGPCRIRIVLRPDGDVRLEAAPLPAAGPRVRLEPITLPGGLGAHKWRDRRLVDAYDEGIAPATPLLVDLDGRVLETTRASVFAFRDGVLITPPLDGRILPGVTRARTLAEAAVLGIPTAERPLTLRELETADAALTSGALRGLEPVAAAGSALLAPPDARLSELIERLGPARRT